MCHLPCLQDARDALQLGHIPSPCLLATNFTLYDKKSQDQRPILIFHSAQYYR